MSDTPRTDTIWAGPLFTYPYIEKPIEETRLIERDLNSTEDALRKALTPNKPN